jgi:hypothetical protein
VQGHGWTHKRIYQELELNLRVKPRKPPKRDTPEEPAVLDAPYSVLLSAMDAAPAGQRDRWISRRIA